MSFLCVLLATVGLTMSACKSTPKPPNPNPKPTVMQLSWVPGNCRDQFIVYYDKDGIWEYLAETTMTWYRFELQPKETKVLSVSGVCTSGPLEGEWMSMEEVVAKR